MDHNKPFKSNPHGLHFVEPHNQQIFDYILNVDDDIVNNANENGVILEYEYM